MIAKHPRKYTDSELSGRIKTIIIILKIIMVMMMMMMTIIIIYLTNKI